MSEYIEREYVLKCMEDSYKKAGISAEAKAKVTRWLIKAPAADVRPVVLCRDCKYSYDSVGGWCCSHGICVDCIVRENFFCAEGEKREES